MVAADIERKYVMLYSLNCVRSIKIDSIYYSIAKLN